jgi:hypothetical protein
LSPHAQLLAARAGDTFWIKFPDGTMTKIQVHPENWASSEPMFTVVSGSTYNPNATSSTVPSSGGTSFNMLNGSGAPIVVYPGAYGGMPGTLLIPKGSVIIMDFLSS